jgi:hypothetical protein
VSSSSGENNKMDKLKNCSFLLTANIHNRSEYKRGKGSELRRDPAGAAARRGLEFVRLMILTYTKKLQPV